MQSVRSAIQWEKMDTIRRSSHADLRYLDGDGQVHVWCGCGNDCCCYWKTGENGGAMDTEDSTALQGTDKTRVV